MAYCRSITTGNFIPENPQKYGGNLTVDVCGSIGGEWVEGDPQFIIDAQNKAAAEFEAAKLANEKKAFTESGAGTAVPVEGVKETKAIDTSELIKIVQDNDNNLDGITLKNTGENASIVKIDNIREGEKKIDDTTPVANTDIYTGKTIGTGGKKKEETPSAVMSFLKGTGNLALAGAAKSVQGAAEAVGDMGRPSQEVAGVGQAEGTGAGFPVGGDLSNVLPSIDSIAPVGPQTSPYVDDSQFVDTMDGQLANQGYMGPQLDPIVASQGDAQTTALQGAPQYDIQGLPTLHQEGGQFIEQTPEEVIAGAQGLVDQTAGALPMDKPYTQENRIGQHAPYDPNSPFPGQGEFNSGFNEGSFDSRDFHIPALAELGGMGERAYDAVLEIVADTNKAIQNIEKVLAETGLIDDPQAIEAVNNFVQEVDKLAEEQPTEEATDDDLDTLMMQAEFDAEMLDEEYDSRVQRLPDRWAPKDEKSTKDSITDFLGDLMTQFTEITGITSQDLMRALIMYAGSRLLGLSGYDSLNFAYKDFEKNIARRFEENKESREFLANSNNLQGELDKLHAQKAEIEATGGDTSGVDRRIEAISSEVQDLGMGGSSSKVTELDKYNQTQKLRKAISDKLDSTKEDLRKQNEAGSLSDEDYATALAQAEETAKAQTNDMLATVGGQTFAAGLEGRQDLSKQGADQRTRLAENKAVIKKLEELSESATLADGALMDIDQFLELAKDVNTGTFGEVRAEWVRFTALFGFNIDEAASVDVLRSKIQNFIEQRMKATKGAISDKEMAMFAKASPNLMMTKEGLVMLLETMKMLGEGNVKFATDMNDWRIENPDGSQASYLAAERDWKKQYRKDYKLPTVTERQKAINGTTWVVNSGLDDAKNTQDLKDYAKANQNMGVDEKKAFNQAVSRIKGTD